MASELLPCPSCGELKKLEYRFSASCGFVECLTCHTLGPLDDEAADPVCDVDAAIDAWNRRVESSGCPWCGCTTNLYRKGDSGELFHCGDCDAIWKVTEKTQEVANGHS